MDKKIYDFDKPLYIFEEWNNLEVRLYELKPDDLRRLEKDFIEFAEMKEEDYDYSPLIDDEGDFMWYEVEECLQSDSSYSCYEPILHHRGYDGDTEGLNYKEFTDKEEAMAFTNEKIKEAEEKYDYDYAKEVRESVEQWDDDDDDDDTYVPGLGYYIGDGEYTKKKWW